MMLGLERVRVLGVEERPGELIVTAETTRTRGYCPSCRRRAKAHDRKEIQPRDLHTFDWSGIVGSPRVRLIIRILANRELDTLKNPRKDPEARKARRRLRRIYELLDGHGRGPAPIREGVTIELLMNPRRHVPSTINDEEIIERAEYLKGRRGGPVTLISGDYRLVLSARADGQAAQLTPTELKEPIV